MGPSAKMKLPGEPGVRVGGRLENCRVATALGAQAPKWEHGNGVELPNPLSPSIHFPWSSHGVKTDHPFPLLKPFKGSPLPNGSNSSTLKWNWQPTAFLPSRLSHHGSPPLTSLRAQLSLASAGDHHSHFSRPPIFTPAGRPS